MKGVLLGLAVAGLTFGSWNTTVLAAPAEQKETTESHFTVYCASGHVGVDSRSAEVMQRQWSACALSTPFASRAEAEKTAVEKFGGFGSLCVCPR